MKRIFNNIWLLTLYMTLLGVGSLVGPQTARSFNPFDFFQVDKVLHIIAYAILSFLLMFVLNAKGRVNYLRESIGISICYGILLECLQFLFFNGRRFEILDIIANIIGCGFGVLVARFFKSRLM